MANPLLFSLDSPDDKDRAELEGLVERAGGRVTVVSSSGTSGLQTAQLVVEAVGPAVSAVATVLAAWIVSGRRAETAQEAHDADQPMHQEKPSFDSRQLLVVMPDGTEIRGTVAEVSVMHRALSEAGSRPSPTGGDGDGPAG